MAWIYFSQTSVIYFCRGFSCCPGYYRGVRDSEVSTRRVLTVPVPTASSAKYQAISRAIGYMTWVLFHFLCSVLNPCSFHFQVVQLSQMLDALLPPAENATFLGSETTEAIFLSALTWSLGGGLLDGGRTVFDGFVKRIASLPQNPAQGSVVGPGRNSLVF